MKEAVPNALEAVRADLRARRIDPDSAHAIELALAEALNNALLHGCRGNEGASVSLRWHWEPARFVAEISDPGDFDADFARQVEGSRPPGADVEGGRGLLLIRQLCDRVEHRRTSAGHLLRLEKRIAAAPSAGTADGELIESAIAELGAAYETLNVLLSLSGALALAEPLGAFTHRMLDRLAELFPEARLEAWSVIEEERPKLELLGTARSAISPGDSTRAVNGLALEAAALGEEILEPIPGGGGRFAKPSVHQGTCLAVLVALQHKSKPFFASGELAILRAASDLLGAAAVGARARERREREMRIEREIEIAAGIQASLLPRTLPQLRHWAITARCTPALETGGDFYDAIPVADRGHLLVVADVMGKGLSSALVAAALRAALRARAEIEPGPGALLSAVNRALSPDLLEVGIFVTLLLLELPDDPNGTARIAAAGHPPPVLCQSGAPPRLAALPKGPPVGVVGEWEYADTPLPIPPGTSVMLFTDGLYEQLRDGGGTLEDLLAIVGRLPDNATPDRWVAELLAATPRANSAPKDDCTLILLRHLPISTP